MADTAPERIPPVAKYMADRMQDFLKECKRLRDKQPLIDYKSLTDTYFFVVTRLGTLEHEVALGRLDLEFRAATRETLDAWRQMWRDFREHRERASEADRIFGQHSAEEKRLLADLEDSAKNMPEGPQELQDAFREAVDAAKDAMSVDVDAGSAWRRSSWLFLRVNLQAFLIYMRYYTAKASFFIFRHSFIFVTSILALGLGYSETSRAAIGRLAALHPQWPWLSVVLAIAGYLLKKYIVDPQLKKLQVRLETKRLKRLALKLHLLRTMALYSRTLRRERGQSAV